MARPAPVTIPTEPIGSIPRPADLIQRVAKSDREDPGLGRLYGDAIRDTIEQFEAKGSPIVTDGEQRKYHSFLHILRTWASEHGPGWLHNSVQGRSSAPPVAANTRPFPLQEYADSYLDVAMRCAHVPVKQAVISPSALSLMYPAEKITVNF